MPIPVTTNITLDMTRPNRVVVWAKQNDRLSRTVTAQLTAAGVAWTPPTATAILRYRKPDGTVGFYNNDEAGHPAVVIDGSTATLMLAEQALAVPGAVEYELNFYTASQRLTSFKFAVNVEASAVSDSAIVSTDYYNALTETIEDAIEVIQTVNFPNRNLLDNPWLTVNQRGVTELTGGGAYNMDRWRCAALTGASIDGLGRVTLTSGTLYQNLESDLWTQLSGKTLTASVRLANGTVISGGPLAFAGETAEFPGLSGTGWVMTMKSDAKTFELYHAQGYGSVTVRAVKLEVGGVSTLQYDVMPDYATELAKCQRYYYRIAAQSGRNLFLPVSTNAANNTTAYLAIQLPTSMRTTPVLGYSAVSDIGLTQSTAGNASWCSALVIYTNSLDNSLIELRATAALTANAAYVGVMNSGGWIEFSADL